MPVSFFILPSVSFNLFLWFSLRNSNMPIILTTCLLCTHDLISLNLFSLNVSRSLDNVAKIIVQAIIVRVFLLFYVYFICIYPGISFILHLNLLGFVQ